MTAGKPENSFGKLEKVREIYSTERVTSLVLINVNNKM